MVKFSFSGKALKYHLQYMGWAYIVLPLAIVLVWALVYTVTKYAPPRDQQLTMYMVGGMLDSARADTLAAEMTPDFPEIQQIRVMPIPLTSAEDTNEMQRVQVWLYSGESDVVIMDRDLFLALSTQEAFLPLEGLLETDIDLSLTTFAVSETAGEHVYGVSADSLYGLYEQETFDNRNSVLAVMGNAPRPDQAVAFVQWLIDHRATLAPADIADWEPRPPFFPEDGPLPLPVPPAEGQE